MTHGLNSEINSVKWAGLKNCPARPLWVQFTSMTLLWCRSPLFVTSGFMFILALTMHAHMTTTITACFAALWICSMQHSLPHHALLTLVCALSVSKVDYCNSEMAGLLVPSVSASSFQNLFQWTVKSSLIPVYLQKFISSLREPYPLNWYKLLINTLSSSLNCTLHYWYFVTL